MPYEIEHPIPTSGWRLNAKRLGKKFSLYDCRFFLSDCVVNLVDLFNHKRVNLGCWSCGCLFDAPGILVPPIYNPAATDQTSYNGTGPITSTELPSVGGVTATCYKYSAPTPTGKPTAKPTAAASRPASTCSSKAECAANGCNDSFHCVDGKCMKLDSKSSKVTKTTKGPSAKSTKNTKVRQYVVW